MIFESNITNDERTYRNFINIVNFRCPNADTTDIKVDRSPKGNWNVYDKDGNKLCLISKSILSDEMVDARNLRCNCD